MCLYIFTSARAASKALVVVLKQASPRTYLCDIDLHSMVSVGCVTVTVV